MPSDSDYQPLPRTTPNNDYLRSIAEGLDGLVGDATPAPVPAAASVEAILVPDLPTNNDYLKRIAEDVGELVARPSYRTLIVTCVTTDGAPVTGQTVTVREGGPNGHVIAVAAYEGQPASFALVADTAYHVSATPTLPGHLVPDTASGIVVDADVAATLTYKAFADVSTAQEIRDALDAGIDLTDLVGEQVSCGYRDTTYTWDVVDYDDTVPEVTLMGADCSATESGLPFEPFQAAAWLEDGLPAGPYSFQNPKQTNTYYFRITEAIPAGGQIEMHTDATMTTWAGPESTVPLEDNITASQTAIAGATSLGRLQDGIWNCATVGGGCNNYGESGIRQWLNSDAPANTPMPRLTKFQRPYVVGEPGFLGVLDPDFVECVAEAEWPCKANSLFVCPPELGGVAVAGETYVVRDKFALPGLLELGYALNAADGERTLDAFTSGSFQLMKRYRGGTPEMYFTRTPVADRFQTLQLVSDGSTNYVNLPQSANNTAAVVPVCKIRGGDS